MPSALGIRTFTVARSRAVNTIRLRSTHGFNVGDWVMDLLNDLVGRVEQDIIVETTIDPALQSGPAFVLGTALSRLGEPAQAALYFLRTPILHPADRDLAAEALLAAGEQLEKAKDPAGARSVYRELIDHYQQHALAPVAEQRLEQLPPKS